MKAASFFVCALALFPSIHAASASSATASFSEAQIADAWGRIVARDSQADQFDLPEAESAALQRGIGAALREQPPPTSLDLIYHDVARFVESHRAIVRQNQRAKNLAAYPAYFAALRKRPGIVALPSGVCYLLSRPGDRLHPRSGQTVTVRYRAALTDGTVFDSTEQMGPVDLVLGKIIPGWTEGLQKIGVGGRITLFVPPPLGLTDDDALKFDIPPASPVVADFELLAIKETPPEETPPPPAPIPPPPAAGGFSSGQIAETWGWILAQERGVVRAKLDSAARAQFLHGFVAALHGEPAPFDEKAIAPSVACFIAEREQAARDEIRQKRLAVSAAFFAELAKNPRVQHLPSGLYYEILRTGHGAFPRAHQRVKVNYVGRLLDGTIFDRTDPDLGPLDIDLDRVMRGWTEGLQHINRGGRIKLYIPPDLAYSDNATGGVPANSTLIFEVELLDITDPPSAR